jgi:hypothetical protein
MRTLVIATVALSFIGAAAIGTTVPVQAATFVHDRQSAADYEYNHNKTN